jgi:cell division protein FtsB
VGGRDGPAESSIGPRRAGRGERVWSPNAGAVRAGANVASVPRRRRGRLPFGGVRLWLLAGGIGVLALLYYRPVRAYLHTHRTLAERSAEVRALEEKKQTLERRLALSRSEQSLVRAARRLGLVEPGERLFIVEDIAQWRHAQSAGRGR